jgi:glycosyltransferase involved in cell wall biosynthesis
VLWLSIRNAVRGMSKVANIVTWDNGGGLSRDIAVLAQTLRGLGWEPRFLEKKLGARPPGAIRAQVNRIARKLRRFAIARRLFGPLYDLNFHIEAVFPRHFSFAGKNIFIPNQDWFRESSRAFLGGIDCIFAKTRYAERLFGDTGNRTAFIGWLSTDKYDPLRTEPRPISALHIAGSSSEKGTEFVLDRWEQHPEWPPLTVVRSNRHYTGAALPWKPRATTTNIRLIEERISESEVRSLQNNNCLHVCPSEAEGYGHIIAEAMSVAAVVITTDGPPMNELISNERGVLVAVERSEPMGIGQRYIVKSSDFDSKIESVLRMSREELEFKGARARQWFIESVAAFPMRLEQHINQVLRD